MVRVLGFGLRVGGRFWVLGCWFGIRSHRVWKPSLGARFYGFEIWGLGVSGGDSQAAQKPR